MPDEDLTRLVRTAATEAKLDGMQDLMDMATLVCQGLLESLGPVVAFQCFMRALKVQVQVKTALGAMTKNALEQYTFMAEVLLEPAKQSKSWLLNLSQEEIPKDS